MGDDGDSMCGRAKLKSQSVKSIATLSNISGSLNTMSMVICAWINFAKLVQISGIYTLLIELNFFPLCSSIRPSLL